MNVGALVVAAAAWLLILTLLVGVVVVAAQGFGQWVGERIREWRWPTPTANGAHDALDLDDEERDEFAAIVAREIGDDETDRAIRAYDEQITREYGKQYQAPRRSEDYR